jgi:hypothetical protein
MKPVDDSKESRIKIAPWIFKGWDQVPIVLEPLITPVPPQREFSRL